MQEDPSIPDDLLAILACPECGGDLRVLGEELRCNGCGWSYAVRGGIPLLYPADIDAARLAEEEKLSHEIAHPDTVGHYFFMDDQWKESKRQFWRYVHERVGGGPPKRIVNVGCGIDIQFLTLQQAGHATVAFDLTVGSLERLRNEFGSRRNVAGAVQALPFRSDSFDCLTCVDLIHHEYDHLTRILGHFERVLKPGGILVLEDINAWGLYQFPKSIVLPKRLHRALRSFYHRLKRSPQRPAEYEFPTSVWRMVRRVAEAGFTGIEVIPQDAYPNVCPVAYKLYMILGRSERVRKYHNFHYMIAARKP